MKYDFDSIIDRRDDKYSYSVKWKKTSRYYKDELFDDAICLQIADMDFKCPPEIVEDLTKEATHGIFGYSMPKDDYYLAVQHWFASRFDFHFDTSDIYICGTGTHTVICDAIKRLTKENDGVIVLTPSYSYHMDVEPIKRRYVSVDMINNDGYYTIDFDAFEKACKDENNTIFILCHPHNPCGRVFNKEELTKLYQICQDNNVIIISDEVHSDLIRKGTHFDPLAKVVGHKGIITCTAVNKTFNLAGLAMTNFIIADPDIKAKYENYMCLPTPFGICSVISAYTKCDQWVDELNQYLDELMDESIEFIHQQLPKAKVFKPEASYIIWIDFSGYGLSDEQLQSIIYDKCHIIDQDGSHFDGSKQFRRFCLASPKVMVREALNRLSKEFKNL